MADRVRYRDTDPATGQERYWRQDDNGIVTQTDAASYQAAGGDTNRDAGSMPVTTGGRMANVLPSNDPRREALRAAGSPRADAADLTDAEYDQISAGAQRGGGGGGGTGGGPFAGSEFYNDAVARLSFDQARQAADNAYRDMVFRLRDMPLSRAQIDQIAVQAGKAAADTAIQASLANAQLRGPRNAFQQQALNYGLSRAGVSNTLAALAGDYTPPSFQAPQAAVDPASLATQAEDIAAAGGQASGGAAGGRLSPGDIMSSIGARLAQPDPNVQAFEDTGLGQQATDIYGGLLQTHGVGSLAPGDPRLVGAYAAQFNLTPAVAQQLAQAGRDYYQRTGQPIPADVLGRLVRQGQAGQSVSLNLGAAPVPGAAAVPGAPVPITTPAGVVAAPVAGPGQRSIATGMPGAVAPVTNVAGGVAAPAAGPGQRSIALGVPGTAPNPWTAGGQAQQRVAQTSPGMARFTTPGMPQLGGVTPGLGPPPSPDAAIMRRLMDAGQAEYRAQIQPRPTGGPDDPYANLTPQQQQAIAAQMAANRTTGGIDPAAELAALPDPNRADVRRFMKLNPSGQAYTLSAYERKGYDPEDVQFTMKNVLPKFRTPTASILA